VSPDRGFLFVNACRTWYFIEGMYVTTVNTTLPAALQRALDLLIDPPTEPDVSKGYLDLLNTPAVEDADVAKNTGAIQAVWASPIGSDRQAIGWFSRTPPYIPHRTIHGMTTRSTDHDGKRSAWPVGKKTSNPLGCIPSNEPHLRPGAL
jgi:hypothetical protein